MKYLTFFIFFTELLFAQWEPDVRLTDTLYSVTNYNHAKCIASSGCTLHIIWYDYRDGNAEIYYKRSTNNGTDWGQDTRLTYDIYSSVYPAIAVSGSAVHIVWRGFGNILYKRSTDGGNTWSPDTHLTNNTYSYDPSIAVSDSHIYVCWWGSITQDTIYFTKSDDAGQTWRKDTALIRISGGAVAPYITARDSFVSFLWSDSPSEIFYKYSNDFGNTWSRDIQLTNTSYPSGDPCGAVSGNDFHVAWVECITTGTDFNYEIFYKHSTDRGTTWSADTNLSYSLGQCLFPSIYASGSNVHLVWIDNYGGYWDLYYKKSSNRGFSWDSTVRLTNEPAVSTYPHITTAGSGVHVIWTDDRNQRRQVYYKRNRTGNIKIDEGNYLSIRYPTILNICPNVVSQSALIRYNLPNTGRVSIKLYDITGKQTLIVKDAIEPAGERKMRFNAKNLPTGVYIVRMISEKCVENGKIIIVK